MSPRRRNRPRQGTAAHRDGRPADRAAPAARRGTVWWLTAAITAAVALVYWNSLSGPFVFDDTLSVINNQQIRDLGRWAAVLSPERELPLAGRPLVNLSFAINYAIGGLDVRGYHVGNIAIHLLCALVLFGLVRRTCELAAVRAAFGERGVDLGFAAALLWALHPLNTETVTYITQRTESMMALCYLLTLYAGVRALERRGAARWAVAGVVACVAGMACKESMVTAPIMVVLYDRIFAFPSFRDAWRRRWAFYAGLAIGWLELAALLWTGPRFHSAGFSAGIGVWIYLLNQTVMIIRYLRLVIWPRSLVINYGVPLPLTLTMVLPDAMLVVALLVLTVVTLARRPMLGFLGAWFFVTLAPTSSFVPIATEVGAERRMYLPLAGLVVLALVAVRLLWARLLRAWPLAAEGGGTQRIGAVALAAVSLALATGTIARNREYGSGLTLAQTTLARWPTAVAQHMVGTELMLAGREAEALPYLRAATGGDPRAHYTLGIELYNAGKFDEAIAELQRFVTERPWVAEVVAARELMGRAFLARKEWRQASDQFRGILEMDPTHVGAQALLADALSAQGAYDEAAVHYRTYLQGRPNDTDALTKLGIASAQLGKGEEAVEAFQRVKDLEPQSAAAHRNLANAFYDRHDIPAAAVEAQQAVALDDRDALAHQLLGRTLAVQGRVAAARTEFERALQLDPGNAQIRSDLEKLRRLAYE